MEPRRLLAGDLLQVGAVYFEEATGRDEAGDVIEITWTGGAPGTQLDQVVINTDKNGDGHYSTGEVFFDTAAGGMGVYGFAGFSIVDQTGIDSIEPIVVDGGMSLVINFSGFDPGEKLVFTIDVDEQGDDLGGTLPPEAVTNAVAEGGEFQGSRLYATFSADHYYEASGWDYFLDFYDAKLAGSGLDLPPDDYVPPSDIPREVYTAGAIFPLEQIPLPISIAGTVFEDMDLDNQQDPGDPGLAGVGLQLYRLEGGQYVPSGQAAVTGPDGGYRFEGLLPGTYRIVESQPGGYLSVGATAGTVNGQTRGVVSTQDVIVQIELEGGEDSVDNDFAETRPVSLSGHVYHDLDNDGVMDPGEAGIGGVLIRVPDRSTPPGVAPPSDAIEVYTDPNGYWEVTGLYPGQFWAEEVQPDGYLDGLDSAGTAGGTAHNPGDRVDGFHLAGGESGHEYNFGELLPSSLSGRVIVDSNGNCLYDPGETLLAGVTVHLLDASGNRIATTATDSQGEYSFTGLAPGVYGVEEIQPGAYYDGGDHVGSAGGKLVPPDSITGVVLVSGTVAVGYDFCELEPAALSGFVYVDRNNNGLREAGEEAIAGVRLELLDGQGLSTGITTTTDASGFYRFEGLKPQATYGVAEIQPAGFYDGLDTPGTAGGIAQNPGDLITGAFLPPGASAENYNFGELRPASISGRVHAELNLNCIVEPGEPLLAGVTIWLLDGWGNRIESTVTNAKGEYLFSGLKPGTYGVEEVQPAGYFDGDEHVGSAGGMLAGNDRILGAKLISGAEAVGYDFCELVPASISGYVFQDGPTIQYGPFQPPPDTADLRDGVFTPDDTPIAGVVLHLGDATGRPILGADGQPRIAVTDARGFYQFTNLEPGSYTILQVHPEGYTDSIDTPGSSGGMAVNRHEPVDPLALGMLTVDPQYDAILSIRLTPGDGAVGYNFSEVIVVELPFIPPPPPAPPPPSPPKPAPLAMPPAPAPLGMRYFPSPGVELLPLGAADRLLAAYTWHLSVVNAGQPRRDDHMASTEHNPQFNPASWTETQMNESQWVLAGEDGEPVSRFHFGVKGGIPLTGDFDGDGTAEVAIYLRGVWFIDLNGNGIWDEGDLWAKLGTERDLPVTGDWDGDGKTDIGIFGPAWKGDDRAMAREPGLPDSDNDPTGLCKNVPPGPEEATTGWRSMRRTVRGDLRADVIDHVFQYGTARDAPVAGDWNGDGVANIGLFRAGTWYLDLNGNGQWDKDDEYVSGFGELGDLPVVGDFNGDGVDEIGVYRGGVWYLDSDGDRTLTALDKVFELGTAGDKPVVGDFNGDGIDEIGVYRDGVVGPDHQAFQAPDAPAGVAVK